MWGHRPFDLGQAFQRLMFSTSAPRDSQAMLNVEKKHGL